MECDLVQSGTNLIFIRATLHGVTFRKIIFSITDICFLSYFELFYVLIVGVEDIFAPYHTHTHSVELFWTRDRLVKETCMRATSAFTTDRLPCPRRDSKPQSQQARATADPRLILRGHRNWLLKVFSEWDPGYKIQGHPCLIWSKYLIDLLGSC
jgi:hypothetical protein